MEIGIAIAAFLMSLIGFRPSAEQDGWTTYRDRAVIVGLIPVFVWMYGNHTAFGLIFTLLALRFRSYREMMKAEFWRGVQIWAFTFIMYLLIQHARTEYLPIVLMGVIMAGVAQACFTMIDSAIFWQRRLTYKPAVQIIGSLGNRTYLGAYMAILTPLVAVPDLWYLFVLFAASVLLTNSRGAYIALFAGLLMVWPKATLILLILVAVWYASMWERIPTSSLLESMGRIKVWTLAIWQTMKWPYWLIGRGFGSFSDRAISNTLKYSERESFVHVHNDGIQLFYEFGIIGVLAFGFFLWNIVPSMHLGNPLTGSAVAIAVASCFTFVHHIGPVAVTSLIILSLLARGVL